MDREYKPQIFTLGADGPKGERLFFFQSITGDDTIISLKCEKSQVIGMMNVLEMLLQNLPPEGQIPLEDLEPEEPHDSILPWVIGDLTIFYSSERDEIELKVTQFVLPDELEKQEHPEIENVEEEADTIKFIITREQADGFLRMAHKLVEMGRPLCEFCMAPLNETPKSNYCPCWN